MRRIGLSFARFSHSAFATAVVVFSLAISVGCSDDAGPAATVDASAVDALDGSLFGDGAGGGDGIAVDAAGKCTDDNACDDGNTCTDDFCKLGACTHPANKANCNDGDACTGGDRCNGGSCEPGSTKLCADATGDSKDTDAGDTSDSSDNIDSVAGPTIGAGDLVITEILYNPHGLDGALSDGDGEWFEIYNSTAAPIDLTGVTIRDDNKDVYNVLGGKTIIEAGAYFVFGRSLDTAVNGGVAIDHAYGNAITLVNGSDVIVLEVAGKEIDRVAWNTKQGWPNLVGKAMQLSSEVTNAVGNDKASAWCPATEKMTSGDLGTPGKANSACPKNDADKDGVPDFDDNCPDVPNPEQEDADNDGQGDACEDGIKVNCGDGILDPDEGCDDSNNTSGDGCSKFCQIEAPIAAGALVISEVLPNPATVTDANGEWFEIHNPTNNPIVLNGLKISVGSTSTFTVVVESPTVLTVATKGYFVVANNANSKTNGGVKADYAYAKLAISNSGTNLALTSGETLVDAVQYGTGWPLAAGKSLNLDPGALDATANDDPKNWCFGQAVFGAGDLGSPGKPNPGCAGSTDDADKDGIPDAKDNCKAKKNPFQADSDNDGVGDLCDNCPANANADQKDGNSNSVGDACEPPYCGNGVLDPGEGCDDANALPADGCSPKCKLEKPIKPGDLVIVELMIDASATSDDKGEWVELYNASTQTVDINGLEFGNKSQVHVVAGVGDLPLAPGAVMVLAISADPLVNGGVTAAYGYSSVQLTNGSNEVRITWAGKVVDSVTYSTGANGWPSFESGRALQLSADKHDAQSNDSGSAWCLASKTYGAGDKGTPGSKNAVCILDADSDEVADALDNCKGKANADQADSDNDGVGDVCDNCPLLANADQADANKDGKGDICEVGGNPKCNDGKTEGDEQCDDGNNTSGDGCSDKCMVESAQQSGELVITEIHMDPDAVSDAAGEWIELQNTTTVTVNIAGWKLQDIDADGGAALPSDAPLLVPAGARVLLGANADAKLNGGVNLIAVYGSKISLANGATGGRIAIERANGSLVDEVKWQNTAGKHGWPGKIAGFAYQLSPSHIHAMQNDIGGNWCLASKTFGLGDKGSPGAANDGNCGAVATPPKLPAGFKVESWFSWPVDAWQHSFQPDLPDAQPSQPWYAPTPF